MEPESIIKQKPRQRNTRPTEKQIKAVHLIAQGMPTATALRKAGYAPTTAKMSNNFLYSNKGIQKVLDNYQKMFVRVGLTEDKFAQKVAEFVDAKKIDHSHTEPDKQVPDYQTQLRGVEIWRNTLEKDLQVKQGKKRELTITEFITGESD